MSHHPDTLEPYTSLRPDVLSLVTGCPATVMDIGGATGTQGAALRARGARVTGIELDPEFSAVAASRLNGCINDDAEPAIDQLLAKHERFDLIISGALPVRPGGQQY